jgi:alpha-maltose-1-phosphate synthase
MMRLAWLCTDPGIPFGGSKGASVHLGEIVAAVAAEGAEILLLVHAVDAHATVPDGVLIETLPVTGGGDATGAGPSAASDLADWLVERLERFRPVALYERLALHSDAGARAARALGIPHLVELNAPLPEEAARYRGLADRDGALATEASVLRSADLVLAVSPPLAERADTLGARRVEVLQNAAAMGRFEAPRRSVGVPTAVFAGSLRPWHGIETIATAWRRLGASYRSSSPRPRSGSPRTGPIPRATSPR